MPLDDAAVVTSPNGRRLGIDVRDVPVLDDTPAGRTPATVSFQITWRGVGARRRLGHPHAAATGPAAFSARMFIARVSGVFSGAAGAFSFQSGAAPRARSVFAELGTERNGVFLAAACPACGGGPQSALTW